MITSYILLTSSLIYPNITTKSKSKQKWEIQFHCVSRKKNVQVWRSAWNLCYIILNIFLMIWNASFGFILPFPPIMSMCTQIYLLFLLFLNILWLSSSLVCSLKNADHLPDIRDYSIMQVLICSLSLKDNVGLVWSWDWREERPYVDKQLKDVSVIQRRDEDILG